MKSRTRLGLLQAALPCLPCRPVSPIRLRTAADILALLEEQVNALRQDPRVRPSERARTIGYLASVGLKAIETGNLEARIEMLETVLKQRNGDRP